MKFVMPTIGLFFILAGLLLGCASGQQPPPLVNLVTDAPERLTRVVMLEGSSGKMREGSEPAHATATPADLADLETTEVLPICDYLAQRLPPRVRPPGELMVYSNHGTALAGCLVEEISGHLSRRLLS
jgi:hypothetical protein